MFRIRRGVDKTLRKIILGKFTIENLTPDMWKLIKAKELTGTELSEPLNDNRIGQILFSFIKY